MHDVIKVLTHGHAEISTIELDPTADPWIPAGSVTKSNNEDASTTNTESTKEKKNDATSKEKEPKSTKTTKQNERQKDLSTATQKRQIEEKDQGINTCSDEQKWLTEERKKKQRTHMRTSQSQIHRENRGHNKKK